MADEIEKKKQEILDMLESAPRNVLDLRKEIIETAALAQEMKESDISKGFFNTGGKTLPELCENYRDDQAVLLGYDDFDDMISCLGDDTDPYIDQLMKFDFRSFSSFNNDVAFTLPTVSNVGYIVYNADGTRVGTGEISGTSSDDNYYEKLYLVVDSSNELVDSITSDNIVLPMLLSNSEVLDENIKNDDESLVVESEFGSMILKGDLTDVKPVLTSGNVMDVYLTWAGSNEIKVAEIDDEGVITNYGGYSYIDLDESTIDYNNQSIKLVFTRSPSNDDVSVEVRYSSDETDLTTVHDEEYSTFDSDTGLFSKTLVNAGVQGPLFSSFKVLLNDEQVGMINEDGNLIGPKLGENSYFNDLANIGVSIRGVITDYQNTVSFQFSAKDYQDQVETIGTLSTTSKTYIASLDSPVCLNNFEVYLESTKILDSSDFTISWTGHVPSLSLTSTTNVYTTPTGFAQVTSCTCTQAGTFSLTLTKGTGDYIYPTTGGGELTVVYDTADQYTEWSSNYTQCNISNVNNSGIVNNITFTAVSEIPKLLESYTIKKYIDHQVYGYVKVVVEGLEVDDSWNPLTGDIRDSTTMSHTVFGSYLGWLNPDNLSNIDDIHTSADKTNYSSAERVGSSSYPYIERSPFFPSTDGEHTSTTELYASRYTNSTQDITSNYVYRWSVLSSYKFNYLRPPTITVNTGTGVATYTDRPTVSSLLTLDTFYDIFGNGAESDVDSLITYLETGPPGTDPQTAAGTYTMELDDTFTIGDKTYDVYYKLKLGGSTISGSIVNDITSRSDYQRLVRLTEYLTNSDHCNMTISPVGFKDALNLDSYVSLFPFIVYTAPTTPPGLPTETPTFGQYNDASSPCQELYDALVAFRDSIYSSRLDYLIEEITSLSGSYSFSVSGTYDIVAVSAASGYWELQKDGVVIASAFNNLCTSTAYKDVMDQMKKMSAEGLLVTSVAAFYDELNFDDHRALFPFTIPTDGANTPTFDPSSLSTATTTFKSTRTGISAINSIIGTVTTSGYAKDIYDSVSYMLTKDIKYVKNVVDKYNDIDSYYEIIDNKQIEYDIYDSET